MSNLEQILRQRVEILIAEIQVLVSVQGTENKSKLESLIAEIEDLNGQLEFIAIWTQPQTDDKDDKDEDEQYVYEEMAEEEFSLLQPPVLKRSVAGAW
jgi:hypothetical protein